MKNNLANLAMSENGFVFNPTTGYSYTVNGCGIQIMTMISKMSSRNEIIDQLAEDFDIDKDILGQDVDYFLLQLKHLALLP